MDNKKETLDLLQRLYIALKDVPAEQLREEFIKQLAEIIHNENKNFDD